MRNLKLCFCFLLFIRCTGDDQVCRKEHRGFDQSQVAELWYDIYNTADTFVIFYSSEQWSNLSITRGFVIVQRGEEIDFWPYGLNKFYTTLPYSQRLVKVGERLDFERRTLDSFSQKTFGQACQELLAPSFPEKGDLVASHDEIFYLFIKCGRVQKLCSVPSMTLYQDIYWPSSLSKLVSTCDSVSKTLVVVSDSKN